MVNLPPKQQIKHKLIKGLDVPGVTLFLAVLMTIGIFLVTRDSIAVTMLLMLPVFLVSWMRGWKVGLLAGVAALVLTAPYPWQPLVSPPLAVPVWAYLSFCFLVLGILVGMHGNSLRSSEHRLYSEFQSKLAQAQSSVEHYEALLEEMSEGQAMLARMNEELAFLNTLATAVNSSLDVHQVQATALTNISSLLSVDVAQIYWAGPGNEYFVLQAALPMSAEEIANVPLIRANEGLFGPLLRAMEIMTYGDVAGDLLLRPPSVGSEIKSLAAIPLRSHTRLSAVLVLGRNSGDSFTSDDKRFLESVGRILSVAIENAKLFEHAKELSLSDELTGLGNRRLFNLRFASEFSHARSSGRQLSVIMFDLDHFKQVNDTHGHGAGDEVLRQFALAVQQDVRGTDLFCRLGGEEFILMAADTPLATAISVAERIVKHISQHLFTLEHGIQLHITVSAGVAGLGPCIESSDDLLAAADRALYKAKELGRNRVEVFTPQSLLEMTPGG